MYNHTTAVRTRSAGLTEALAPACRLARYLLYVRVFLLIREGKSTLQKEMYYFLCTGVDMY